MLNSILTLKDKTKHHAVKKSVIKTKVKSHHNSLNGQTKGLFKEMNWKPMVINKRME